MIAPLLQGFLDEFERLEAAMPGYEQAWLRQLRRDRLDAFVTSGLPGRREEAWKYTPLKGLEQRAFALPRGSALPPPLPPPLDAVRHRLVFVDGRFAPESSRLPADAEIEFLPLSEVFRNHDAAARFRIARLMGSGEDALDHLNAALATDGLLLRVPAGRSVREPVHLVYLGSKQSSGRAWHLRGLIELEGGARLRIVEHFYDGGEEAELSSVINEIQLAADAELELVRFQDMGARSILLSRTRLQVEARGRLRITAIDRGGELVRSEWLTTLRGREAHGDIAGVARLRGRQHADQVVEVRHLERDTSAEVRFRGVAEDQSRAVFTGTLHVAPGASGAETRLSSRNLLLSPQAEVDTRPVLEIHHDEVVAAHGATVGQLDPEALFYLRSRGFSETMARAILIGAFLEEISIRLPEPRFAEWVSSRMGLDHPLPWGGEKT
ncbi:MAG: Fe-S cluster assembly protein SufD [Lysobacterales bacterium]|jgi:Fe-S cluster assembly protein SufD|nr:MAG: Fe-S cluster assembly protein SufD [Xanthomonadales bacterium]